MYTPPKKNWMLKNCWSTCELVSPWTQRFHAERRQVLWVPFHDKTPGPHCQDVEASPPPPLYYNRRRGNHLRNYLDDGLLAVGDLHANKHPCIVITHHHHRVVIGQQLYEWPTGPAHAATDNELLSCRMVVNLCL